MARLLAMRVDEDGLGLTGTNITNIGLDFSLKQALTLSCGAKASDARDVVYGVLGLTNAQEYIEKGLSPDYRLLPCEIYCCAIRIVHKEEEKEHTWEELDKPDPLGVDHDRSDCDESACGSLDIMKSWRYAEFHEDVKRWDRFLRIEGQIFGNT